MRVTFPVTFSLTELKVGLTAVFISRIGTVIVKLSQPPPADVCSHFKCGKQTGTEISVLVQMQVFLEEAALVSVAEQRCDSTFSSAKKMVLTPQILMHII